MFPDAGRLSQPSLAGQDHGVRPVGHLQFVEDIGGMIANGLGAEDKPLGNFDVVEALRHQVEDLALALGQLGEGLGGQRWPGHGEETRQTLGNRRAEESFAAHGSPDGTQYLGLIGAFQDIPTRSGPHRGKDRIVVFEHRQDDDADIWIGVENPLRSLDAVQARHLNIHQDYVGLELGGLFQHLFAAGCLAYHFGLGD